LRPPCSRRGGSMHPSIQRKEGRKKKETRTTDPLSVTLGGIRANMSPSIRSFIHSIVRFGRRPFTHAQTQKAGKEGQTFHSFIHTQSIDHSAENVHPDVHAWRYEDAYRTAACPCDQSINQSINQSCGFLSPLLQSLDMQTEIVKQTCRRADKRST